LASANCELQKGLKHCKIEVYIENNYAAVAKTHTSNLIEMA